MLDHAILATTVSAGVCMMLFRRPKRRVVAAALSCVFVPVLVSRAHTGLVSRAHTGNTVDDAAQRCSALADSDLPDAQNAPGVVMAAHMVDAPETGIEPPLYPTSSGFATSGVVRVHRYCDVRGYVAPQNKFALKLPIPDEWNGKFFFEACGGFCGTLEDKLCNLGLARGYASVTSNGGHDSASGFDGVWAANAPELQEDFGWRSTHVVTQVAKALTTRFYGKPIAHSFLAGNSKGGQAVLMEAQRFPEDFDGLLPSAPVYDYTGRNTTAAAWFAQAVTDGHGGSVLDADAANAVHASVLAQCGAQAGVDDDFVADPLSCHWRPDAIACSAAIRHGCLSPNQVSAIKRLMTPATNSKGETVYPYAYLPGSETQWVGWNYFGAPSAGIKPRLANLLLPQQFLRYMVDPTIRAEADALTFNFDRDPARLDRSRRIYDATSADLRAFKSRGGRILLWHGWADGAIPATSSIGYYEKVVKFIGDREQTDDFFRLFLIPGVHHGGGGPGLTQFDALGALETWVERGKAPDRLLAWRTQNGVVERSRPVFPYPVLARYSGKGDPMRSESFVPVDPSRH